MCRKICPSVTRTERRDSCVSKKVSYRLAQRAGSYVVLKYVRPVVKRRDTQQIHCAPGPRSVIEGSRADVSFIAGLLVDKFAWHLPLLSTVIQFSPPSGVTP